MYLINVVRPIYSWKTIIDSLKANRLGMQNNLKVFENKQAEKPKQDSQNGLRLRMPEGDLNNNYII
jgi:hypothetical protein